MNWSEWLCLGLYKSLGELNIDFRNGFKEEYIFTTELSLISSPTGFWQRKEAAACNSFHFTNKEHKNLVWDLTYFKTHLWLLGN